MVKDSYGKYNREKIQTKRINKKQGTHKQTHYITITNQQIQTKQAKKSKKNTNNKEHKDTNPKTKSQTQTPNQRSRCTTLLPARPASPGVAAMAMAGPVPMERPKTMTESSGTARWFLVSFCLLSFPVLSVFHVFLGLNVFFFSG